MPTLELFLCVKLHRFPDCQRSYSIFDLSNFSRRFISMPWTQWTCSRIHTRFSAKQGPNHEKVFQFFLSFISIFFGGGGSATTHASPHPRTPFPMIIFWSTTLLTGMTGISFDGQWPPTSQSHCNFLIQTNVAVVVPDQTLRP
jgi:hypothetical protein